MVQGGVTSATLNAVVAEKLPGPGTVFLNVNWDFKAPVRPGDIITGRVEIVTARADKPITTLRTTVTRDDGTVALDGTAVCDTMALPASDSSCGHAVPASRGHRVPAPSFSGFTNSAISATRPPATARSTTPTMPPP